MRYIDITEPGGPEVLKLAEGPSPEPGPGEVLIKVEAAGVNRADVVQRQGFYPPPPGASPIPGLEAAGEIAALGEGVEQWRVGDAVCALLSGGGYAEFALAAAGECLPVPEDLSAEQAAALPEAIRPLAARSRTPIPVTTLARHRKPGFVSRKPPTERMRTSPRARGSLWEITCSGPTWRPTLARLRSPL